MSAAEISSIVVAAVSLAGAATALLRAEAARVQSQATDQKLSDHLAGTGKPQG